MSRNSPYIHVYTALCLGISLDLILMTIVFVQHLLWTHMGSHRLESLYYA